MKKTIFILSLFFSAALSAKNNVQTFVDNVFTSNMYLKNSVISVYVEDEYGREVASCNPDMPLLTASVTKTITTGLALKVLGPDYRFVTKLAYSGHITDNGTLEGDLYIVGGADPTLGMDDYDMKVPADSIFAIWREGLAKAGIKSVNGLVIGDDRIFNDESSPNFWTYGDLGSNSGAGSSGLPYALNQYTFDIVAGQYSGDPVKIIPINAVIPELQIINDMKTGKAGSSTTNVACRTTRLAPVIRIFGSYPAGNSKKRIVPNQFSALTCAYQFQKYLSENGIKTSGYDEIANVKRFKDEIPSQDSLVCLSQTFSPQLKDIIYITNRVSQNFFAEVLFRMVGKKLIETKRGHPVYNISYKATQKAVREYFIINGIDLTGYKQIDGSGLSRKNNISAAFLTRFYNFMLLDENIFPHYLESLPVPGQFGTLDIVLKNANEDLKSKIHAKSGSLDDARTYAGYARTKSGYIRFSILTNNLPCPIDKVQTVIEQMMLEIAKYAKAM